MTAKGKEARDVISEKRWDVAHRKKPLILTVSK